MTKLEQLYDSIRTLKELGVQLPDKLIEETNRVEEEIIRNEVIPLLAQTINPLISQIQRELVLVIDYIPNEPIAVRLTRKRSLIAPDETSTKQSTATVRKDTYSISPHNKSAKTVLSVTFPNGEIISEKFAYQTLVKCIRKIGYQRVSSLGLKCCGVLLVSNQRDDFYSQIEDSPGTFIMTHSATSAKKQQLDEISKALRLNLKVDII